MKRFLFIVLLVCFISNAQSLVSKKKPKAPFDVKYNQVTDIYFVNLNKKFFNGASKGKMNLYNVPFVLKSPEYGSKMKVKNEKTKKVKIVTNQYDVEFHFFIRKKDYAGFLNVGLINCDTKGNRMWNQELSRKLVKHKTMMILVNEFLIKQ